MTVEQYVQNIIEKNPDFAAEMDRLLSTEYSSQIAAAQKSVSDRVAAAREKWIKNRGEAAYFENADNILSHIKSTTPRYCYIKSIELCGDSFEVEIDLLDGTWSLTPVSPKMEDEFFED